MCCSNIIPWIFKFDELVYDKLRASNSIASISCWKFNQWEWELRMFMDFHQNFRRNVSGQYSPLATELHKTFLSLDHLSVRFKHTSIFQSYTSLSCNKRIHIYVRFQIKRRDSSTSFMQIFAFSLSFPLDSSFLYERNVQREPMSLRLAHSDTINCSSKFLFAAWNFTACNSHIYFGGWNTSGWRNLWNWIYCARMEKLYNRD